MTAKTRYFVIVSLLVVGVGLGTGLVAYYIGFPARAFFSGSGPEELRYMPDTASVVAAVDVREIMASDVRQRLKNHLGGEAQENASSPASIRRPAPRGTTASFSRVVFSTVRKSKR
jgi:hypothetical protein